MKEARFNKYLVQIAQRQGKLYLIYSLDSDNIILKSFDSIEDAEKQLGKSIEDVDMFDLLG